MNEVEIPGKLIDQLRANLTTAGISLSETDLQGMLEKGFLRVPLAFGDLMQQLSSELVPDYLKDWSIKLAPGEINGSFSPAKAKPGAATPTTIAELAPLLQTRAVSPVELTRQCLERIAERDATLNSFQLVLTDYALQMAQKAEQEIVAGNYRGPLHGVPVAVKDLLAMAGTRTTAGSKILGEWVTDFNSAGVERLQAAGAIIVGKTRMSEFAYSPGSNNAHYGPTRNPRNLEYDTGGSSSGSGAAVAGGLVYAALGTDTGGSIRIPASQCGLVGLKPTFGRVSLYGGVTLAWSLDHLGPMTHSVTDAALMLQVLAGYDPRDSRTRPNSTIERPDLQAGGRGLRIGVLREDGTGTPLGTPEVLAAWKKGLVHLEQAGAELIELDLPLFSSLNTVNGAIIGLEAAAYHQPMLRERLADFGEFMRHRVLSAYAHGQIAFIQAQQARANLRRHFEGLFDQIDLLSTPTMPAPAPLLGIPASTRLTGPFNLLGWPTISVPVGETAAGLPLGLQLAGKPWDEATVLQAARIVEAGLLA